LADWTKIKAVKEAVSVPVFANGNILYFSDIAACLEFTGADAVMSAEGNLYNPALFRPSQFPLTNGASPDLTLEHLPHADLALEYLQIVKEIKTPTEWGAIKGHLFKILRPGLATALDLRNKMGNNFKAKAGDVSKSSDILDGIAYYEDIVKELKERMDVSCTA
jgi:tRNA-dihydrouridine synthase 1